MKTNLFRNIKFPLLGRGLGGGLFLLCVPVILAAQNGVTVSGLAITSGTVTFNVSWNRDAMPVALWSDTVWVFVDYNKNGVMERLPVTSATASAGTVTKIPNNDKGVWVAGNARSIGSFSATVRLFTTVSSVGGACVYASNYPPVGEYIATNVIKFTGTPPYTVMLEGVSEPQTASSYYMAAGTIKSFTDKTGAPGVFSCIPSTVYNLKASASGFCAGDAGVTFALSGTQPGRSYELYRDGTTLVATLTGNGSAATFSDSMTEGVYTAKVLASPEGDCEATMDGTPVSVSINPIPNPPTMTGAGTHCTGSADITATAGTNGNGIKWDDGTTVSSRNVTNTGTYSAITTSAANCTSSTATVAVTVGAPGTSGGAYSAACGCAGSLNNCSGTCRATCGNFTVCAGFTDVSTVSYEGSGAMNWSSATSTCSNKSGGGWRLPTLTELGCLCANKASLPGGYVSGYYYWSMIVYSSGMYYSQGFNDSCSTSYAPVGNNGYVKCVK